MPDSRKRSLAKSFSWRLIASLTTALLVFAFTRQIEISAGIGLLDALIKIGLYYGHERLWNHR